MAEEITVRPMLPSDGPALNKLNSETPDTGALAFYTEFHGDPFTILTTLDPDTHGVVAQAPDHEGIVGMGLVTFGQCMYEGELRPSAYLSSLSVHPSYRRRGIASKLSRWRVEEARKRFAERGKDGVIYAGIQSGNQGSLSTAVKWNNQRIDKWSVINVVKMRTSPPKHAPELGDIQIRPAESAEFEQIAEKQNAFYSNYNLYTPQTAGSLHAMRSEQVLGQRIRDYYVAVEATGKVIAGMALIDRGKLMSDHVLSMPVPMRIANLLLKMMPADGVSKRISVEDIWFSEGQLEACRLLWESIRWLWRDRGTIMMSFYDPRGPIKSVIRPSRLIPPATGSIVLSAEPAMKDDHLLYFQA